MKTIRVGVAGLGFGAAVHVPGLRSIPGVEVVGIAGGHRDTARDAASRLGIATGAGSWEELFDLDLHAVSLALPPLESERACRVALERGIAVLSEKPLAATAATAAKLRTLSAGIPSVVDFEFAELPAFRKFKQLIDARLVGDVRHVHVSWLTESYTHKNKRWSWKADRAQHGGVTTLLGSHLLFLLEWIFGDICAIQSRVSVSATAAFAPRGAEPADDTVDLWIKHASGLPVTATYSNACPGTPGHRWDCVCADGTITLRNETSDYMSGFEVITATRTQRSVEFRDQPQANVDGRLAPFRALATRFIESVRTGAPAQPDFVAGARVQNLMEQVLRND